MIVYYRSRKPVEINAEHQTRIDTLMSLIGKLSRSDVGFAQSLASNLRTWGRLSDKQLAWVDTLTQRAQAPAPLPTQQVNVQKIQDLFALAAQKLRRVKVALQAASGQKVVFTKAGPMSKYAGQILITDGGPFGANKFFGRIDANGDFFATRTADKDVQTLVKEFADNPADVAGRYGRLTGGCSFCNHKLDDNRSLQVGYGPVCAKRFGLVWG
jgi:hypothetical protein